LRIGFFCLYSFTNKSLSLLQFANFVRLSVALFPSFDFANSRKEESLLIQSNAIVLKALVAK